MNVGNKTDYNNIIIYNIRANYDIPNLFSSFNFRNRKRLPNVCETVVKLRRGCFVVMTARALMRAIFLTVLVAATYSRAEEITSDYTAADTTERPESTEDEVIPDK